MSDNHHMSAYEQVFLQLWQKFHSEFTELKDSLRQSNEALASSRFELDQLRQEKKKLENHLKECEAEADAKGRTVVDLEAKLKKYEAILYQFGIEYPITELYDELNRLCGRSQVSPLVVVLYINLARFLLDGKSQDPLQDSLAEVKRGKAMAVVSELDGLLFEVFKKEESKLTSIRETIRGFFMSDGILSQHWQIEWPKHGERYDDRLHQCLPSNRTSDTIRVAKSCLLRSARGEVLHKSDVETE